MKGHTTIKLTNISTGKVEIYEDDNVFQNSVIASYMRSMGAYNNSPYANSTWRGKDTWVNLVGGIFLFKNAIDTTQGPVKYMPAGNQMVGNGSYGIVNNSNPTELGSWNSTLSNVTENTITLVYDFTSSQANGTIRSICLTSDLGGYIGYGNLSGQYTTLKSISENQSTNSKQGFIYQNELINFSLAGDTSLTVTRTPISISEGSLLEGQITTETYEPIANGLPLGGSMWFYCGNGIFRRSESSNTAWNGSMSVMDDNPYYYIEYNAINKTYTLKNFINHTGQTLLVTTGYSNTPVGFDTHNHAIFYTGAAQNFGYPVYLVNLTTGALDATIDCPDQPGLIFTTHSTSGQWKQKIIKDLSNGLYIAARGSNNVACIYDIVNNTTLYTNMASNISNEYHPELDVFQDTTATGWRNDEGGIPVSVYKNPLYLATINNLSTPITKTSEQTMQIVYTLTKD